MDDPSWNRNCDLLAKALQSLDSSTSKIRRSTNKLLTLRDIATEREKVKRVTSSTNAKEVHAVQDALGFLERYMRLHPAQLRGQGMKLTAEAQVALDNYKKSCDAFYKRCMALEESLRSGKKTTRVKVEGGDGSDDDDLDEGTSLLRGGVADYKQKQEFEDDLYNEIMAERMRETKEIADSVRDINDIFNHIHSMVEEQGVGLDAIENNVTRSSQATRSALSHLQHARENQRSSRCNRMLMIFVVVLILMLLAMLWFK
ncbi:unnamed protein product [Trypanosoma congolense IL3000]|uniref:Uncharacterized protein TCIL3000_3_3510 n=1 Tax=Trypanosoma congolense (strain IL3000) TaxID=1068625 RepID=F9W4P9_TRYCI|nr:unnamed protein product [Trypanosoma congolense IL3000]CCD12144.1 unnamed protein product [Trypanosoma congolense IL3000]